MNFGPLENTKTSREMSVMNSKSVQIRKCNRLSTPTLGTGELYSRAVVELEPYMFPPRDIP